MKRYLFGFFIVSLSVLYSINTSAQSNNDNAYQHLYEQMDRYHNAFYIYSDRDEGGNHYLSPVWCNGTTNMSINDSCTNVPFSGCNCIKIYWNGAAGNNGYWNGVRWQDTSKPM